MGGAFAGFENERRIDSGDTGMTGDIARTHQDEGLAERQAVGGAALQQELGTDALADAPLPPPRAHLAAEARTEQGDRPIAAVSRPVGRAAVRKEADNVGQDLERGEPETSEAADAGSKAAHIPPDEDSRPELAVGKGSSDGGDLENPTLETGDAPEEFGDKKKDEVTYEFDEEKDFIPDARTGVLPRDAAAAYKATALDGPKAETLTAEQEVVLAKRIEAGLFAGKLVEVMDGAADLSGMDPEEASKLTAAAERYRDQRDDLEEMAADGKAAKDEFIVHNLRLSFSMAMTRAHATEGRSVDEPMDLVTRGNDGVIRAVEKFDYTKGYKFSTYATPWIKQAMERGRQEEERTVRLPAHIEEDLAKLQRVEQSLRVKLRPGEEVTIDDIAAEADMKPERVADLMPYAKQAFSLNQWIPGTDNNEEYGDGVIIEDQTNTGGTEGLHPDPVAETVVARLTAEERASMGEEVQALLGDNQQLLDIVARRYGLLGHKEHRLQELADEYGVSRETIRNWEKRAFAILQHPDNIGIFERFR